MAFTAKDEYLKTCSDWFSFHLSHVDDTEFAITESSWSECEKCRDVYESLQYTSHEGEFGLMTREVIENLIKRQRVKAKLVSSLHVRRGNVPQYISFVTPVPVYLRPSTGESSGYGSSPGVSIVSEDLLLPAGTQDEIIDDRGLETGLEIGSGDRRLGLSEAYEEDTSDIDVACSEDVLFSPSSQFSKSSLSQYEDSGNDAEGSFGDPGRSQSSKDRVKDGDMVNCGEFEIAEGDDEEGKQSPTEIQGFDFEDICEDSKSGLANLSVDDFNQYLDTNLATELDDFNASDGNRGTYKYNDDLRDASDIEGTTNGIDPYSSGDQDPTKKENVSDNNNNNNNNNNLQVTFSEPLAIDRHLSTNGAANDDNANRGQPKSILKGNDDTKSNKNELEVESSMIKRKTSLGEESRTTLLRPAFISREEVDLRPALSRPNLEKPDEITRSKKKESNDEEATDNDNSSDADYISDHGSYKVRRPKPKTSIYAKRANLKARNEKRHRKKTSDSDATEDEGMSAESSLLKEQILEQEKRLKEGMKSWLKGRLGLSQQNSRFEIPMDVRLLETMTPLEYLANYCVISKRRKALYKHVFQKVDRNRDGSVNYTELEKGLKDVHTGVLDSGHIENITQMVNIDKEGAFDLKQFSAVAAFSERISCKFQLPIELLNNLEGQKDVIETADFFALSWKLDGIRVNPEVKTILDSL